MRCIKIMGIYKERYKYCFNINLKYINTRIRILLNVIISYISDVKYTVPDTESPKRVNSRQSGGLGESPWKPKRFANSNQFLPANKQEEVYIQPSQNNQLINVLQKDKTVEEMVAEGIAIVLFSIR